MSLPAEVEREKREFEEQMEAIRKARGEVIQVEELDASEPNVETEETADDKQPEQTEVKPTEETDWEGQEKSAPEEEPQEPEAKLKASSPEKEKDAAYWKSRANTIAGEHTKAKAELQALKAENDEFRKRLDALEKAKPEKADDKTDTQPATEDDLLKYFDKEFIEEYGEEFCRQQVKIMAKIAQDKTQSRLDSVEKDVGEAKRTTAEIRFWENVEELAPGANKINKTDPGFIEWLQEPIPYTGTNRQGMAQHALAQGDVELVAKFFNDYKATKAEPETQPPTSKKLEKQVSPHTAAADAPKDSSQKPTYTEQQVDAFYNDCVNGKYTDEERARIDAQIKLAYKEGRVTR